MTADVDSPLSTAATFTPAVSTTVAKLRTKRDAFRAVDVLAANMVQGMIEKTESGGGWSRVGEEALSGGTV